MSNLERRDSEQLWQFKTHYDLCEDDLAAGDEILDELLRRKDSSAQFERARLLEGSESAADHACMMSLMRASAEQGNARAAVALKRYKSSGYF